MADLDVTLEMRVTQLVALTPDFPGLVEVTLCESEGPWRNPVRFRIHAENAPKLGAVCRVRFEQQP